MTRDDGRDAHFHGIAITLPYRVAGVNHRARTVTMPLATYLLRCHAVITRRFFATVARDDGRASAYRFATYHLCVSGI